MRRPHRFTPGARALRRSVRAILGTIRRRSKGLIGVLAAGWFVAIAVALLLSMSKHGSHDQSPRVSRTGVACPDLREAFAYSVSGEEAATRRSVEAAARAGELALDRSGQTFGRPEEIAIELRYALAAEAPTTRTQSLFEEARRDCTALGHWPT
jgi:hypothetical protein